MFIKKTIRILAFFMLCGLLLTGCGAVNEDAEFSGTYNDTQTEDNEYYDIQSRTRRIFKGTGKGAVLGTQYYHGEPVQLWTDEGEDIYLCYEDGTKELVLEGVPDAGLMSWYVSGDGGFCCWKQALLLEPGEDSVVTVLDSTGKETCRLKLDEGVILDDISWLEDGRILVLGRNQANGAKTLEVIDPTSGSISGLDGVQLSQYTIYYIASGAEGLLVLERGTSETLREVSREDGSQRSAISFSGTTYSIGRETSGMLLEDFRLLEDGGIELLWYDTKSRGGTLETLQLVRIEREVIVMRAYTVDSWMKERVVDFNQSDGTYYVVLEECPKGISRRDYITQTSVQIGTGKGPDILYGQMLESNTFTAVAGKGAFEDLAPYLEEAGLREEDYFPFAFNCWREGERINAICFAAFPTYQYVEKSVLDGETEPDIRELVSALLSYDEEAYYDLMLSEDLVSTFLKGSEDFWGMLDWENGTCDFSGELFAEILEVARKYGCGDLTDGPDRPFLGGLVDCKDLYYFDTMEELEAQGRVMAGMQFDDGCHAATGLQYIATITESSGQKEGAWRFLCSLLGEKAQNALGETVGVGSWMGVPANRAVLEAIIERDLDLMEEGSKGYAVNRMMYPNGEMVYFKNKTYEPEDITEERIAEYIDLMENVRYYPFRTAPLLDIILEEAEYYFQGDKSVKETAAVIENRVQLYMDENR